MENGIQDKPRTILKVLMCNKCGRNFRCVYDPTRNTGRTVSCTDKTECVCSLCIISNKITPKAMVSRPYEIKLREGLGGYFYFLVASGAQACEAWTKQELSNQFVKDFLALEML